MKQETFEREKPLKQPLSKFGLASLILGGISLVLFLTNAAFILLSGVNSAQNNVSRILPTPAVQTETPTPAESAPSLAPKIETASPADVRYLLLVIFSLGANILGLALGMGGLFQPDQSKALTVSGLTLNGLMILIYCCVFSTTIPAAA